MEIDKIKAELIRGDYDLIAKISGYSKSSVIKQLNGSRTLVDKVKVSAEKVIESRRILLTDNI